MANFKKKVLKNGLRVIAVPMKGNDTVTVLTIVEAGSNYENKKENGISHFLEHMVFKGTEKRRTPKQISVEFDSIGAQNNAYTGTEYTGYYGKAHLRHFDKVLDIISDMYLNPILPDAEIEKERGVIIEEINMYEDLPQRKVHNVFAELLYGDQPAGRSIIGPKENIKRFKRDDFVSYRASHYVPGSTVVVIAGGVTAREAFAEAERAFGGMESKRKGRKKKVVESQRAPKTKTLYKKSDQAHLVLGVRAFDIFHKDTWTLAVLSAVLGRGMSSRLFTKLRDELGMSYYVYSSTDLESDHGSLFVSAGVTNRRVDEATIAILDEFRRLRDDKVNPAELKKAKDMHIGRLHLGLETSDALAFDYGHQELMRLPILTPKEAAKKIRAITAEDVQRVAKKIFKNEKLNLAIVGPFKDGNRFKKILKI